MQGLYGLPIPGLFKPGRALLRAEFQVTAEVGREYARAEVQPEIGKRAPAKIGAVTKHLKFPENTRCLPLVLQEGPIIPRRRLRDVGPWRKGLQQRLSGGPCPPGGKL